MQRGKFIVKPVFGLHANPLMRRMELMKSQVSEDNTISACAGKRLSAHSHLQRAFEVCVDKTRANIKDLADAPGTWAYDVNGRYENFKEHFYAIGNWTSSFFTGMALLAWRETGEESFLHETLRLAPVYREKAVVRFLDMHHDAGFLYTLYSVALYKMTRDKAHRDVGLAAARALAQRFSWSGNFIRAWGRLGTPEQENLAIVDGLMNLPLLYWAANESGDRRYNDIAVRHADMVLKHFIRPDDTVFHAFRFDLKTGQPFGPANYCGYSTDSYWARGAAWAIYGFALSYGYTHEKRYLDASMRLARKFIDQLDAECVPVWDFWLPADERPVRDASAAVIMACAIQELSKHSAADPEMLGVKDALLARVCSDDYLDTSRHCRGVLKSAYGDRVAYSSWGDYFLMEACCRELSGTDPWW